MVPDWIFRIIQHVTNTKQSLKILFGTVFVFSLWPAGVEIASRQKVPDSLAIPFIVLASFCLGVIFVELILLLKRYLLVAVNFFSNQRKARILREDFEKDVKLVIPRLPKNQRSVLYALKSKGTMPLDERHGAVYQLESKGFIHKVSHLEYGKYIYEADPLVLEELDAHLSRLREEDVGA